MAFTKDIRKIIETYGNTITVTKNKESVSVKAFIQPLKSKTDALSDRTLTMSGFKDTSTYLYLGLPDINFSRNDDAIIESNGKQYVVHTSEVYHLCDEPLYVWAVLKPHKKRRQNDDTD